MIHLELAKGKHVYRQACDEKGTLDIWETM